jgi:predicted O-methyltransferase YrrM
MSDQPNVIADLQQYYRDLGLADDGWHLGPEHPSLEQLGVALVTATKKRRILEIGVQAGGFAVPVILAVAQQTNFSYLGVDNREYTNAVPLKLVADYLRRHGVTEGVRLVEADSTTVLRTAERGAFDLILMDHYKPKYPFDLLHIFRRDLLSDDGAIVLHDVLAHAAREWAICTRLSRAYGYTSVIDATVFQGAGIIRRAAAADHTGSARAAVLATRVISSWHLHAGVLRTRRAAGRTLRAVGLR